jgi:hypothetical protein
MESLAAAAKRYGEQESTENEFPGAYQVGTIVLGLMRDSKTWTLAEIYKVRKALFFSEEIDEEDFIDENSELTAF